MSRHFLAPPPLAPLEASSAAESRFSIVIAAYEVAPFIAEAVRSALNQTRPPHEVIVCDDGSTDGLEAALAPFRDRIVVIGQEHAGVAAAKDAGARAASGDFVAFLDGDDSYEPARLEALGALAAARPDLDILSTDGFIQVGDRKVRRMYDGSWTFETENQRLVILERPFVGGNSAVRRQRFLDVGGFDRRFRAAEDWDLWIRLILDGSRAGFVREPLATWRVREGSLSTFRVELFRWSVRVSEKTAARDDLSGEERRALGQALKSRRRDLALAEAREGLVNVKPGRRRRLLRLGAQQNVPFKTRVKVLSAAVVPGFAGRLLRRQDERYWIGAGDERVPRSGS
jgi:glycosyltransferase involved in cell wall biosynthesis